MAARAVAAAATRVAGALLAVVAAVAVVGVVAVGVVREIVAARAECAVDGSGVDTRPVGSPAVGVIASRVAGVGAVGRAVSLLRSICPAGVGVSVVVRDMNARAPLAPSLCSMRAAAEDEVVAAGRGGMTIARLAALAGRRAAASKALPAAPKRRSSANYSRTP